MRPTLKARYPLIPIERYIEWRRPDGSHFDPWIRVHERIGGEIFAPAPESMVMDCPGVGLGGVDRNAVPGRRRLCRAGDACAVYVRDGRGRHVEPNVWLRHRL